MTRHEQPGSAFSAGDKRAAILENIRASLQRKGNDAGRRIAVSERLTQNKPGIIPAHLPKNIGERTNLFQKGLKSASASSEILSDIADIPLSIAAYLREHNLAPKLKMGDDPRLAALDWSLQPQLTLAHGPAEKSDEVGFSYAFGAIAETGTLAMISGAENPTTINFLPDHHIVLVNEEDIAGSLEEIFVQLRWRGAKRSDKETAEKRDENCDVKPMPRTLNLITGPSRSADIEQKLHLGAHGPRALHVLILAKCGDPVQAAE